MGEASRAATGRRMRWRHEAPSLGPPPEKDLTRSSRSKLEIPLVMAGSKYAYVRNFELPDPLLPGTFLVYRLDGHSFHR